MGPTKKFMPQNENTVLINILTGERKTPSTIRDCGYKKVWLYHMYEFVRATGNKQSQIMFYLAIKMNGENIICQTQAEIAEATECSERTVRDCIKSLSEPINTTTPFMVRIGVSKYRINPDMVYKGSCDKRTDIQTAFNRELEKWEERCKNKKDTD